MVRMAFPQCQIHWQGCRHEQPRMGLQVDCLTHSRQWPLVHHPNKPSVMHSRAAESYEAAGMHSPGLCCAILCISRQRTGHALNAPSDCEALCRALFIILIIFAKLNGWYNDHICSDWWNNYLQSLAKAQWMMQRWCAAAGVERTGVDIRAASASSCGGVGKE